MLSVRISRTMGTDDIDHLSIVVATRIVGMNVMDLAKRCLLFGIESFLRIIFVEAGRVLEDIGFAIDS